MNRVLYTCELERDVSSWEFPISRNTKETEKGDVNAQEKRERISATNGRLFHRAEVLSREFHRAEPSYPGARARQGLVKGINKAARACS